MEGPHPQGEVPVWVEVHAPSAEPGHQYRLQLPEFIGTVGVDVGVDVEGAGVETPKAADGPEPKNRATSKPTRTNFCRPPSPPGMPSLFTLKLYPPNEEVSAQAALT